MTDTDSINTHEVKKWCPRCERHRPLTDFYASYTQIDSVDSSRNQCKTCEKLRAYGLTFAQYEKMRWDQNGLCAICGQPQRKGKSDDLIVDHDHTTGVVRGLLCAPCNLALGHFEDDVERMQQAIEYIKRHKT